MALVLLAEFSTMTDLHGGRESKPLWHVVTAGASVKQRLLENHCHSISYSYMLPYLLINIYTPLSTQIVRRLEPGYRPGSPSHA